MPRDPLFSAGPRLPRNDIKDPPPGDSGHPASWTAKIRRFLLTDGDALFTAERRQAEYHAKTEATTPTPRT